jgi:hypothetical protein
MAFLFFTSYARLDNREGRLTTAVNRLRDRLIAKTGENVEIFFDTQELKNGVEWQERLGAALKDTRVIVCLCSPAYLKSAFCAKEFEIFRLRVEAAAGHDVAIIPIVWEPSPLPEVIRRFYQPKDPRFPSDYYVAGLYKLSVLQSQVDNFVSAIEAVADDVDQADQNSKLPPYAADVLYDQLPDFFHNPKPGRYGVTLTVLNDRGSQWKPGNVRNNIGKLMDDVALALRVPWEDLPAHAAKLATRLTASAQDRLVSVFTVDYADTSRAPWQQMVQAIDQARPRHVGVVVGWPASQPGSPADIKSALSALLPSGVTVDYFPLNDEAVCKETLKRVITTLRMALIAEDDAAKVVAPELREDAVSKGIPVDSISTLQPPGAGS